MIKTRAAVLNEMGMPRPYAQSKPVSIEELNLDGPGESEVLVEVSYAGLCHSDLSVIDGNRPRPMPMVLGHEASGVVRETGRGVSAFAAGDHVVFSYVPVCGRCRMCVAGRGALCEPGAAANLSGALLRGGRRFNRANGNGGPAMNHHLGVSAFSQFTVAAQESLVKMHPEIPLKTAAIFGCAILTGVGAIVNCAKVEPGASVAIFGLGGVGLSSVLGAVACGAHPIIAVDLNTDKLARAKDLGATHVIDASKDDPIDAIRTITSGGVAYAIESVGSEKALASAFAATMRGGTTIAVGLPHPSKRLEVSPVTLVAEERTLKGAYMGSCVPARDVPRFAQMYLAGKLPVEKLLTGEVSLDQINEAFDRLADAQAVRQLVKFQQ